MEVTPGTRLGPYEILAPIGSGGMGEVWKAKDIRLGRTVAVKICKQGFSERFEREARSIAALNHPHICQLYDVGSDYLVMEHIDGRPLHGPLPPEKAIAWMLQICDALDAAHRKSIVHRDLKPANILVTRDGVKLLDFGLAKVVGTGEPLPAATATMDLTSEGQLTGTLHYMSPEQLEGHDADVRSDIFSCGLIFYELLTGKRAFQGASTASLIASVLKEEPAPLIPAAPLASSSLERIVRKCLEKNPDERWQSVRDLKFAIENFALSTTADSTAPTPPRRRRSLLLAAAVLAFVALAGFVAFRLLLRRPTAPNFHRLTFRRGRIHEARFAPDGNSIIYSAQWEDERSDLFAARLDMQGSRVLGFPGAEFRAVSLTGELAMALNTRVAANGFAPAGTLARAPYSGGAPRLIEERIDFADWSPDGKQMAVAREADQGVQLEYPLGNVIYRTPGYVSSLRIAPDASQIAFIDHPTANSNGGSIAVVTTQGARRILTREYTGAEGLAWSPDSREIWFTASLSGFRFELRAVSLDGRERLIYGQAVGMILRDIARDGRVLFSNIDARMKMTFRDTAHQIVRDLSWLDWSLVSGISGDGKLVVFSESGEGAGQAEVSYVRETSGAPAVNLGPGSFPTLSTDGQFVVTFESDPPSVLIYPTGAGNPRRLPLPGYLISRAGMLPGNNRLWINASESGHGSRYYVLSVDPPSQPKPITPEGVRQSSPGLTPDNRYLVGLTGGELVLYPIEGGPAEKITGIAPGERIAGATRDGRYLFIFNRNEVPARIYRLDWRSGRREVLSEVLMSDRAGILGGVNALLINPDGNSYAYSVPQQLSELYWMDGLK